MSRPPPIGSWDHLECFLGLRGYGKSTLLVERAMDLAHMAGGAYMVGHSLGARLPVRLPDGTEPPISYHKDVAGVEKGVRSDAARMHVAVSGPADDVIQLGRRLSLEIRERAWKELHGRLSPYSLERRMDGIPAVPVIVAIDEGVAIEGAGKKDVEQWFREWVYSLRHEHTALLYSIQSPTGRNWLLLEQATTVHVFRIRHEWALNALRAAGAPPELIAAAPKLPKYKHLSFS